MENSAAYNRSCAGEDEAPNGRRWQRLVVAPWLPVIVLVLAFTAVPVELRPFSLEQASFNVGLLDVTANIVGYIPVGMVLAPLRPMRALGAAALLTLLAESLQFFMVHRFPSPVDATTNLFGALIGLLLVWGMRVAVPVLPLNRRVACVSVLALTAILGLKAWAAWRTLAEVANLQVNDRGATAPGTLEAHWTFDDVAAERVRDASGNHRDGLLVGGSALVEGIHGQALHLDRVGQHVNFGSPVELRLMGSMTICAWINSSSFPIDDAVIVSSHDPGFQLDTTVDTGRRTIGFKLKDPCGEVIARYGATELARDRWYHVAGVYDADARMLDVYLDGQRDNGDTLGTVPPLQQASDLNVFVGRRSDVTGYEFSGRIDDVRVYSRALTPAEIQLVMNGEQTADAPPGATTSALAEEIRAQRLADQALDCPRRILRR